VYLPKINQSLAQFKEGWNHHGIHTANSMSPHQLFAAGALQLQRSGLHGLDFFSAVDDQYGVEEVGLPPEETDELTTVFLLLVATYKGSSSLLPLCKHLMSME
jgi:hypothetical protein